MVTGASSGIGASVAVALGSRGAHVGLMARRESELAEVAKAVEAAYSVASQIPSDDEEFAEYRRLWEIAKVFLAEVLLFY